MHITFCFNLTVTSIKTNFIIKCLTKRHKSYKWLHLFPWRWHGLESPWFVDRWGAVGEARPVCNPHTHWIRYCRNISKHFVFKSLAVTSFDIVLLRWSSSPSFLSGSSCLFMFAEPKVGQHHEINTQWGPSITHHEIHQVLRSFNIGRGICHKLVLLQ